MLAALYLNDTASVLGRDEVGTSSNYDGFDHAHLKRETAASSCTSHLPAFLNPLSPPLSQALVRSAKDLKPQPRTNYFANARLESQGLG